jgi:hypothetical protein
VAKHKVTNPLSYTIQRTISSTGAGPSNIAAESSVGKSL